MATRVGGYLTYPEAFLEAKRLADLPDIRQGLRDPLVRRVFIRLVSRSDADKRRAVRRLLRDPEMRKHSDRTLALKAGVSKGLVQNVRREMFPEEHATERIAVRHGREYTINTSKIASRKKKRGGREAFDRPRFLIDLDRIIDDLIRRGETPRTITRKAVIEEPPFNGENITPGALTKRLREAGIKQDFSHYVELRFKNQVLKNAR
jgi:hypothetical protein